MTAIQDTTDDWTIETNGLLLGWVHRNGAGKFEVAKPRPGAHKGGSGIPVGVFDDFASAQNSLLPK